MYDVQWFYEIEMCRRMKNEESNENEWMKQSSTERVEVRTAR